MRGLLPQFVGGPGANHGQHKTHEVSCTFARRFLVADIVFELADFEFVIADTDFEVAVEL
jgi:hypothetical protein